MDRGAECSVDIDDAHPLGETFRCQMMTTAGRASVTDFAA
jgi:hypothetical protein